MELFLIFWSCLLVSVCCQSVDDAKQVNPDGCGKRLNDFPSKIVGGYEAQVGDWGWMTGINYNGGHLCGASLINSQWILTAAHCLYERKNPLHFSIEIGNNDKYLYENWTQFRRVKKIILHESYIPDGWINDIALMKLDSLVKYSKYIVPACIPTKNIDYSGQASWSTGWAGTGSRYLLEVVMPILNDTDCYAKYEVDSRIAFCVGVTGGGIDTCQGDSGGPLIVKSNNNGLNKGNWTLAGITSFGLSSCTDGGVVTRVSNYYEWIINKIQNE